MDWGSLGKLCCLRRTPLTGSRTWRKGGDGLDMGREMGFATAFCRPDEFCQKHPLTTWLLPFPRTDVVLSTTGTIRTSGLPYRSWPCSVLRSVPSEALRSFNPHRPKMALPSSMTIPDATPHSGRAVPLTTSRPTYVTGRNATDNPGLKLCLKDAGRSATQRFQCHGSHLVRKTEPISGYQWRVSSRWPWNHPS